MMDLLRRPASRQFGWVLLALVTGFAAGNFHATRDAVEGSSRWWAGHEKRHLTAVQQQDFDTCAKVIGNLESN